VARRRSRRWRAVCRQQGLQSKLGQLLDRIHIRRRHEGDGHRPLHSKLLQRFATFVHGTKCAAKFSGDIHAPTCWICKDQHIDAANIVWETEKEA